MPTHTDIVIVGAGPVGTAAALALNQAGFSVTLIDKNRQNESQNNEKNTKWFALGPDILEWLQNLGWGLSYQPIDHLTLSCQGQKPDIILHSHQAHEPFLTGVIHSDWLCTQGQKLLDASSILFRSDVIEQWHKSTDGWLLELGSGDRIQASLVIGADGGNSAVRSFFQPAVVRWDFQQKALVFRLSSVPIGCAYEHFFPNGSLAVLSLEKGQGAGIWIGPASDIPNLDLPQLMATSLGITSTIETEISIFDVHGHWVSQKIFHRCVLIGDAAHAIHPIAGQGLNLGLRNARRLVQHIIQRRKLGLDLGTGLESLLHIWGIHSASMQMGTTGLVYALCGVDPSRWWALGARILSLRWAKTWLIRTAAGKMTQGWNP